MRIKKREVLFSVIIVLVMLAVGIYLCNCLTRHSAKTAEKYATATVITEHDQFRYGMDTNFGNALVYGEVTTDQPVTFPEIDGGYIYIERIDEHYTRHTRTVTVRDSNGHTHTRTETYYTWDRVGSDDLSATTIRLLGEQFEYGAFDIDAERLDLDEAGVPNRWNYIYDGGNDRSYYNVVPVKLSGTVFANLHDGSISDTSDLYRNQTPDTVIEKMQGAQTRQAILFWAAWILLIAIVVFRFIYAENRWLD